MMGALAKIYDPDGENTLNPLAWPLRAEASDVYGLAYYRKLVNAGVSAVGRTVHSTPHVTDMALPEQVPEVFESTLRDIVGFVESLA